MTDAPSGKISLNVSSSLNEKRLENHDGTSLTPSSLNDGSCFSCPTIEEKPKIVVDGLFSTNNETGNVGDPTFGTNGLGDTVAVNFEPSGRVLVQKEVNFMTPNLSLSMRRTLRTRASSQQRPPIDPETALALITKPHINYRIKAKELLSLIKSDPETADLKICLYIVACESRAGLKPYPITVLDETEIGQESLSLVNEEIPSIKLMKLILSDLSRNKTSCAVIAVLHWLLVSLQEPKLKRLPSETFHSIFQKVARAVNFKQPSHVFKLMFKRSSPTETSWKAKKGNRRSYFAFYTDNLDRMHSIVHIGLYPALLESKGNIGLGMYFYTDLKHCLDNAGDASCWGWGKSELGVKMKVVLVVEFLEDPQNKLFNEFEGFPSDQKALTNGTDGYNELYCYFVPKLDEIRIRYILVFVQSTARNIPSAVPLHQKTLLEWIVEHRKHLFLGGTIFVTLATRHDMHLMSMIHGLKAMVFKSPS